MRTPSDVTIVFVSMAFVVRAGVVAGRKKSDAARGYFFGGKLSHALSSL
jgi:hypothetical protein